MAEAPEAVAEAEAAKAAGLVNGSESEKAMLPTCECLCPGCYETVAATCIAANETFLCPKCSKRFTLNIPDWAPQEKKDAYRVAVEAAPGWVANGGFLKAGVDLYLMQYQIVEGDLPPYVGQPVSFVPVLGEKGPLACVVCLLSH